MLANVLICMRRVIRVRYGNRTTATGIMVHKNVISFQWRLSKAQTKVFKFTTRYSTIWGVDCVIALKLDENTRSGISPKLANIHSGNLSMFCL